MGRAKGEAARTKSRPSSSSLAASLLPPGATAVGFGGYVGGSRVDCSLTSTSDAPPSTDIDVEVAQHLKRLSRKDTTTKLKALTSLSKLIKQKTSKEIGTIFPLWAFEYKKLLLDYNREVRRATHDTMACLVSSAGGHAQLPFPAYSILLLSPCLEKNLASHFVECNDRGFQSMVGVHYEHMISCGLPATFEHLLPPKSNPCFCLIIKISSTGPSGGGRPEDSTPSTLTPSHRPVSILFTSFYLAIFRRDLAPHLKLLIGPWWVSQFDSVYEVSQAAKRSFQAMVYSKVQKTGSVIKPVKLQVQWFSGSTVVELVINHRFTISWFNSALCTGFGSVLAGSDRFYSQLTGSVKNVVFGLHGQAITFCRLGRQTAFPAQERRVDALILYSSEIFTYIEENLKLTPESLSDIATASDELEEMHQQVLSSSLLALAAVLDVFVSGHFERSDSENMIGESKVVMKARTIAVSTAEKLCSSHRYFHDFLKSQRPAIRSAAYSVVRSCIKNIPHAISEGDVKVLAGTVLGSFKENNPACHASMWDALILFTKSFPDSWTCVNVQKSILSRLWNFLRSGCYGSQQVSYPALVLFLEAVPSEAITGNKFFLEFFQSLWEGRYLSYSSNADRFSFFLALEECFIWGLRNASRYCEDAGAIYHFQRTLVDEIIIGLLWHEYLLASSSKNQDVAFTQGQLENSIQPIHKEPREAVNSRHSKDYEEILGKCIIKILSEIHCLEHDLLLVFALKFQADCLDIFQRTENSSRNLDWVVKFVLLLDKQSVRKGETWPLLDLVGPTLKKTFPLIEALDSPDAVRLILVGVSIFGPRKITQELLGIGLGAEQFLKSFYETFIPLCLKQFKPSSAARLDLLLALLDVECFSEQWDAIITYLVNPEKVGFDPDMMDRNHIAVLAILMDKVREKTRKTDDRSDLYEDKWQHELLDLVAVNVVRVLPPFGNFECQFLCAVLGGGSEDDKISFVSQNTLILVFEEVLRRLMTFMMDSTFAWVQNVCPLLFSGRSCSDWKLESSDNLLEMAHFALDILNGSFFCLNAIEAESELVQGILAAIFIIDWEFSWIDVSKDKLDGHIGKVEARLALCEAVHALRSKICDHFLKDFSVNGRKRLGTTLIQSVKSTAFVDKLDSENFISSCCQWSLNIFEFFCQDQVEEQQLLEQFLSKNDLWPLWIIPDHTGARLKMDNPSPNATKNAKFIALVDKLISKIGFDRVVAGCISEASPSTKDPVTDSAINQSHYSRPWLAAEVLCTWKWLGGSVLQSFLPSFVGYVKNGDYGFSDSVLNILVDGALVHGSASRLNLLWRAPVDELEAVEEPFLRALVSLLSSFFQDNVWENKRAQFLFKLLLDKLYIGDIANVNCLRILPPIMNILVRPLSTGFEDCTNDQSDLHSRSELHNVTVDWLKKTVSFPPLTAWQAGEDMEDWLQLVISCFPIIVTERMQGIKPERDVFPMEREALYELFQKQRQASSAVINKLPSVQKLLSELIVISVAYCWEYFDDNDWKFVLHQLRLWIEAAVVMLEEIVENVNYTFLTNGHNDLNASVIKLENMVMISDPFPIELARNALVGISLFSSLPGLQETEHTENLNPLRNENWDFIMDRIFEGILRLFFCTAAAEAIANLCSNEASSIIASSRLDHRQFWELVASCVVQSSTQARGKAVKSVEIWGLSTGAISSLYALLFSCKPLPPLQFAAFSLLSAEPIAPLAFARDTDKAFSVGTSNTEDSLDLSPAENVLLREEISYKLEKLPYEVLEMDLVAHERVNALVAWCLLLSHIASLPSSSPKRERLIQYVQDSTNSVILDCLFQHIPLELFTGTSSRKKDIELPATVSEAANAAKLAITSSSVLFSLETLWPITPESMASLAGATFGLMLHNLPAYVRGWFSDIRDRSASSSIESFTKAWCSPTLISNELSQVKKASFADDNFSISVSKSANEVVATYTKDETGMGLVIRLPPSYPLRPVDVDCTRSLGISEVKCRKWLMSLMSFVRNQNGALAEAIRIWKSNFDKEFEGVEECPICYSVIHTVNHSMPRLACKTCKHKFHSACLYKWFSTSHKSTCPLCQSPF
ncbi:E3 ubiquitin-protein ligase listerin [Phtheirospermum japonicum]|uniref:E3 ubiquitin-protein ligase listerin n=1 Tax=Phtheirospermum japonicum TaxID=374723 RepID=A0A830CDR9_9LAMI|nr:E3 ubiquitin-protein ligase listerin [Phtheirospermum japonicum]